MTDLDTTVNTEIHGSEANDDDSVVCELVPVNDKFKRILVEKGETVVLGRRTKLPECCRFDDARISSAHCSITHDIKRDGRLFVKDTSSNGTFLNGERLQKNSEVELKEGDEIGLVVPNTQSKFVSELPLFKIQFPSADQSKADEADITATVEAESEPEPESPLSPLLTKKPTAVTPTHRNTAANAVATPATVSTKKRAREDDSDNENNNSSAEGSSSADTSERPKKSPRVDKDNESTSPVPFAQLTKPETSQQMNTLSEVAAAAASDSLAVNPNPETTTATSEQSSEASATPTAAEAPTKEQEKPKTPFDRFCEEQLKKANGGAAGSLSTSQFALFFRQWKALSEEEQRKYQPQEPSATSTTSSEAEASTSTAASVPSIMSDEKKSKMLAMLKAMDGGSDSDGAADPLEQQLTCSICSEILYKCVSCLPCLHNFCASCYSQWMKINNTCPQCRNPVKEVRRNHQMVSVVETFLAMHPNRRRSPEELAELDKANLIKDESLRVSGRRRDYDDDDDDEYSGDEYSDDDRSEYSSDGTPGSAAYITSHTFGRTPINGCRECQTAGADGFRCDGRSHIRCSACFTMMPNRIHAYVKPVAPQTTTASTSTAATAATTATTTTTTTTTTTGATATADAAATTTTTAAATSTTSNTTDATTIPLAENRPQQCAYCMAIFCSQYWGSCRSNGILLRLRDHTMHNIPSDCLMRNSYERQILIDYMNSNNLTPNDVFREICTKLTAAQFTASAGVQRSPVNVEYFCCQNCATTIFSDLLYDYRASIPKDRLPAAVTARADCWFGRNCRTQTHKLDHARRLNHICEQTKR